MSSNHPKRRSEPLNVDFFEKKYIFRPLNNTKYFVRFQEDLGNRASLGRERARGSSRLRPHREQSDTERTVSPHCRPRAQARQGTARAESAHAWFLAGKIADACRMGVVLNREISSYGPDTQHGPTGNPSHRPK